MSGVHATPAWKFLQNAQKSERGGTPCLTRNGQVLIAGPPKTDRRQSSNEL